MHRHLTWKALVQQHPRGESPLLTTAFPEPPDQWLWLWYQHFLSFGARTNAPSTPKTKDIMFKRERVYA